MNGPIQVVETITDTIRVGILEEIITQPLLWEEADLWAKHECPYLSKNKTCIGLISGKTEPYVNTPFYCHFPKLTKYLSDKYKTLTRINIQKINVLSKYGMHIDSGDYFVNKNRFTLCLQSHYKLTVGDVTTKVNPGEVIWFDNKQPHEAVNVSTKERIAVIFDVPMVQQ